jgi:hypothetical protein
MSEQLMTAMMRLDAMQRQVGDVEGKAVSDQELARRFLPYSGSTLSRVRAGCYGGNLERIAEQTMTAVEEIEARLAAIRLRAEGDRAFVRTTLAKAVMASVQRAKDMPGRRVVVCLAPTGAGKSKIGEHLVSKGAICAEGRESWRHSYKAFCRDIADAAGRPIKVRTCDENYAESEMLSGLRTRDGVLYIDEANTLGAAVANAIKLIVNRTGFTVVVASIPEFWDRFIAGAEDEVRQIVNRCQPILRWSGMTDGDVRPFLTGCGLPEGDLAEAVDMVRAAGNEFGAFKTVRLLADALRAMDKPTIEDVRKELGFHERHLVQAGVRKTK